ncbi:hypothetical protein F2Q68_00015592 [Brassica cretica]|uniref:Uncharacterized protein n=1 Tax=Brassica cretica TaxID=69181 RepID=A0A8S9HME1_BRACR|nr:hypothetical protein F2Q68_00015592 [Brassica cretica]
MPPRTKQKSVKTPKITRENYVPPPNHNAPTSYPWPRAGKEGQPITIDDPMLLDFNCEGCDKESAKRYNSLLHIEILPTCFGYADTLIFLGLDTDVFETLHAMGIAPLCYQTHEHYPDLFRKVLATAHIGYDDPRTVPSHSWLTASSAPSCLTSSTRYMRFWMSVERWR